MKEFFNKWKKTISVFSAIAVVFIAGFTVYQAYEELNKYTHNANLYNEVDQMYLHTAEEFATDLNKQIEKISNDPADIKESDLKGINTRCIWYEDNSELDDYSNFVYNYDGIALNCGVLNDFYNENFGG